MNTIPTAEEFLKEYKNDTDHYADQDYSKDKLINALKEFTKLHVQKALKKASEEADIINIMGMNCNDHAPYYGECSNCGSYNNYEVVVDRKIDKGFYHKFISIRFN